MTICIQYVLAMNIKNRNHPISRILKAELMLHWRRLHVIFKKRVENNVQKNHNGSQNNSQVERHHWNALANSKWKFKFSLFTTLQIKKITTFMLDNSPFAARNGGLRKLFNSQIAFWRNEKCRLWYAKMYRIKKNECCWF